MCQCNREVFSRRRAAFFDAMAKSEKDSVLVVPAAPVFPRNNDVDHDYRQDSDFFYLTGFDEPQSVLVLDSKTRKVTLFVRPRDPERETWDGPRAGVDGAKAIYGADESFTVAELDAELPKLINGHERLYYRLGKDRAFDERIIETIDRLRTRARAGMLSPTEIVDTAPLLHEMRLFKSASDIETMRAAVKITEEAHILAMGMAKPGMHEYQVEAVLLDTFRKYGSERAAYGSIVGSGPNACILHYRSNNRLMGAGDLLLIDAGCEYGYYASDVTRTFPVSGTFSPEQQAIYELVLEAQLAGIEATQVGATLEDIH